MIEDTIAAIATPAGEGGIGIIRISGSEAQSVLNLIFPFPYKPRELTYGYIKDPDTGMSVDEVLAVYMPAPKTYTKEDVVEINCHGGIAPLTKVLKIVLDLGVRMAEPGEFTKRAFLNGRIDLSQAEAVLDIINAKTEDSLEVAVEQLQGKFSREVGSIREKLTNILVDMAVNIDYPDEDIEEITVEKLVYGLDEVAGEIDTLIQTAKAGKILRDGLNVVIAGKPNAGKSTLLNALLRESRAIVTDIPGTTRDTIEEFANIKGIPVKLTDTAGIRETEDKIEVLGIERSKKSMKEADLILMLIDLSEKVNDETRAIIESISLEKTVLIFNKSDKTPALSKKDVKEISAAGNYARIITSSLTEGKGIKEIENAIFDISGYGGINDGRDEVMAKGSSKRAASIVTNVRHLTMLERAAQAIKDARTAAVDGAALELVEIDVRAAYEELGFITGDSVAQDIIDEVFSRFCLGK